MRNTKGVVTISENVPYSFHKMLRLTFSLTYFFLEQAKNTCVKIRYLTTQNDTRTTPQTFSRGVGCKNISCSDTRWYQTGHTCALCDPCPQYIPFTIFPDFTLYFLVVSTITRGHYPNTMASDDDLLLPVLQSKPWYFTHALRTLLLHCNHAL